MDLEHIDRDFGTAVRMVRLDRSMSQEELAAEVTRRGYPLSQATVGKIERGERKVTVGEAQAIAAALDSSTTQLILGPSYVTREILEGRLRTLRRELIAAMSAFDSGRALAAIQAHGLSDFDQEWMEDSVLESIDDVLDEYRKDQIVENEASERREELDEGPGGEKRPLEGLYAAYRAKFGNTVPLTINSHAAEVILRRSTDDG